MTDNRRFGLLGVLTFIILSLIFFWKILLTNLILSGVDAFLYFYPYKAYAAEALRQGRLPLWNPHLFMGAPLLANSQVGLFYPPNWLFIWLDAPRQVAWSIGLHISLAGLLMLALARRSLGLSRPASLMAAVLFAFGGYLGAQVEHINQLQAAAWLPLLFLLYDLALGGSSQTGVEPLGGKPAEASTPAVQFGIQPGVEPLGGKPAEASTPAVQFGTQPGVEPLGGEPAEASTPAVQPGRRRWVWFFLMALTIGLSLLAGHAQTSFISLAGLGLYALWRTVGEIELNWPEGETAGGIRQKLYLLPRALSIRRLAFSLLRHFWPLAFAVILAVALAAVQLLPTAELSNLSIRSSGLTFRETVSFSLRPTVLHYALLPPFNLDLSQPLGEAFSEWVAYLGISGLILALLGAFTAIWQPLARRFVFISGSGLILSLGLFTGPLYLALYKFVPGFNLFRVPARWLLLYAFGMAILAGFGFESLRQPASLQKWLFLAWRWLCSVRLRLFYPLAPILFLLALIAWKTPPLSTLLAWLIFAVITLTLIYYALRTTHYAQRGGTSTSPVLLLRIFLLLELLWAAQALNYNQPTAPQAYHSMRNATAFLLAADPPRKNSPPARFLSLSGITYDPGDLAELGQVYGDRLSEKALYHLVVATKEKEVLFFNLPLLYGLHSVDGYDGGLLPLTRFVAMQRLFLPPDELSMDGRLREKLQFVPANHLLSLLNARWIITDKVFDVWIDGIFYDLQFPAYLTSGQMIETADLPNFPATALGLVSHLEGAAALLDDTPVAEVEVTLADGSSHRFLLKAGLDTAEGSYPSGEEAGAAHRQVKIGVTWPYQAGGVDYISVQPLESAQPVSRIWVRALLPAGQFVLRGLSLIHQPTTTSRSILLSTEGDYRQVHSGDVKVYENRAVLPRAFIVHQAELVANDQQAITLMQSPQFEPSARLVRVAGAGEAPGVVTRGEASAQDRAVISRYEPERVEIEVKLASPGWLVLTDSYYPGWQASLDGQPVEIWPVDILFRAVAVPEGTHTVVFEFKPASFQQGALVTGLALLATVTGMVVVSRIRTIMPRNQKDYHG